MSSVRLLERRDSQTPSSTHRDVAVGDVIAGKYVVRAILGGTEGRVVEAFHAEFEHRVVIRLVAPSESPRALQRFRRETRALGKLESEHAARIMDAGRLPDGTLYLVRPYFDGIDLAAYVRNKGGLPIDQAVRFILQAAEAVAETHANGLLLREIRPDQLFVARRSGGGFSVRLIDFGTAKSVASSFVRSADEERTHHFTVSPYGAPEIIRRSSDVDARADVWSLGTILYEMIAGFAAFDGSPSTLMLAIVKSPHTPLATLRPDVPAALDAVIERALAKDPDHRFATVQAFARALLPLADAESRVLIDRISGHAGLDVEAGELEDLSAGMVDEPTQEATRPPASAPPPSSVIVRDARELPSTPPAASVAPPAMPLSTPPPSRPISMAPPAPPRPNASTSNAPAAAKTNSAPPLPAIAPRSLAPATVTPRAPSKRSSLIWLALPALLGIGGACVYELKIVPMRAAAAAAAHATEAPVVAPVTPVTTAAEQQPAAEAVAQPTVEAPAAQAPAAAATATAVALPATSKADAKADAKAVKATVVKAAPPPAPVVQTAAAATPAPPPAPAPVAAPAGEPGTLVVMTVGGTCAVSVNGASKGSGAIVKASVPAGAYTVRCKPDGASAHTRSVNVVAGQSSMVTFKL
jgi:serine/threonine-protein kinase